MNNLTIIGNLTRDPETRSTPSGKTVCTFDVAVNRRDTCDFFRINAWGKLGESCQQYLSKGRKVGVNGSVSVHAYSAQNGEARATMDVLANDVEFLTPREEAVKDTKSGFEVVDDDDLPFV